MKYLEIDCITDNKKADHFSVQLMFQLGIQCIQTLSDRGQCSCTIVLYYCIVGI